MSKCSSYLDDLGYEQLAALCREREQGWMYNIVAGGETESLILALSSCGIRVFKLLVSEKHLERAMVERDADCFLAVLFLIKL